MKFAIAGTSGHTGRVAAETLLAAGHSVRVIVRDAAKGQEWKDRGAEVAIADLGDSKALAAALTGVDGAYLLLPPRVAPGFREYQTATGKAIVAAVEAAAPKHVVFLSSIGAQYPSGNGPIAGLYPVEQGLRAIHAKNNNVNATFLRAGYFMENLGGSLGMLSQGLLPGFSPVDSSIQMIATQDIGTTAAQLLAEGGKGVQVVELGSARTLNDAAAALTELTGQPVKAVQGPIDQMVPTLTGFGFPAEIAELYREMTEGMERGRVAFEGGAHRRIEGKTSLATVLKGLLAAAPTAH